MVIFHMDLRIMNLYNLLLQKNLKRILVVNSIGPIETHISQAMSKAFHWVIVIIILHRFNDLGSFSVTSNKNIITLVLFQVYVHDSKLLAII